MDGIFSCQNSGIKGHLEVYSGGIMVYEVEFSFNAQKLCICLPGLRNKETYRGHTLVLHVRNQTLEH
ncbi:hypothetical protein L6452_03930 [Arctium lappa]|uniref:Uncharacterized protein n=1 Tax=Arctium lappa TaxID=4217 RepID=A0ACB9FQ80_ARCLA|nr:hypothetical protein L6452_03930 [Arctium lappa]